MGVQRLKTASATARTTIELQTLKVTAKLKTEGSKAAGMRG